MAAVSRPSSSHSRPTKLVEGQHTGTSAPASVPDTWPHSVLHNEDPQHRPPTIAARNGSTLTSHFSQLGYVGFHALVPFRCDFSQVPHSFSCSEPPVPRELADQVHFSGGTTNTVLPSPPPSPLQHASTPPRAREPHSNIPNCQTDGSSRPPRQKARPTRPPALINLVCSP